MNVMLKNWGVHQLLWAQSKCNKMPGVCQGHPGWTEGQLPGRLCPLLPPPVGTEQVQQDARMCWLDRRMASGGLKGLVVAPVWESGIHSLV